MEKIIRLCHHIFMIKDNKKHTIGNTLEEGRSTLKNANIESFDIDSRILLSYILGLEPHEIFTNPKAEISTKLYNEYIRVIRRRSKFEPIAQITKTREFWAIPFKVSKQTLIPRPDSETIIEAVQTEFKNKNVKYKILDMGTGTGCLLLSLLHEYKNATGFGIDIKNSTIKTAKENAKKLSLHTRAKIVNANWQKKKPSKFIKPHKFNIIISNPPYITAYEMNCLAPDVKKYEPHIALYGGKDGLDEYRNISKALYYWNILADNGKIFLEIGKNQQEDVKKIFEAFGFKFNKYFKDLSGIIRVIEFSKR